MNDKQIQEALQEIATTEIPNDTNLWPEIASKVKRPFRPNIWQWGMRLVGTAVTGLVLLALFAWIFSIPRMPEADEVIVNRPTASATRLPFSFTAASSLTFPTAPETLPLYEVKIVPLPQTSEEMLDWVRAFGVSNPELFINPRSPEQLIVVDSDGSRLLFPVSEFNQVGVSYLRNAWLDLASGENISTSEKVRAAETFLIQHNQLPTNYHVVEGLSLMSDGDGIPITTLQFSPDLSGFPILQNSQWGTGIGANVFVDSSGGVFSASFAEAGFAEMDRVNIRPAAEVVADFIDGGLIPIWHERAPARRLEMENITRYKPPLPIYTIGEQVTILDTDYTHLLIAEDGSEVRVTLRSSVGVNYELVTPELARIAEIIGDDVLHVTGRIETQLASDTWRLVVESWETMAQQEFADTYPSGCVSGPVTIEESGVWITAESVIGETVLNGRYQLENLPTDVQAGDLIEACSSLLPEVGGTIHWSSIFAPPRDFSGGSEAPGDEYIIESVRLVYFYDSSNPALALASPAWVLGGHSIDGSYNIVVYLDGTE